MDCKQSHFHLWVPNLFEFKGGIQVYLTDVLQGLVEEFPQLSLSIFDKLDQGKPADRFAEKNLRFVFSGHVPESWRSLHYAWSLMWGFLRERPQLIICSHLNFAPIADWIHRLTGTPYWIVVYGVDAWNITDPWRTQALQHAEKIVSISGYTRDRLVEEQNLSADKIPLLPVTFDASRFDLCPKPDYLLKRYGLAPDQPVILTVTRLASLDRYKGYDQILQALPKIRQQLPDVHYLLAGKGDDRPRIEALIQELGVQDCVTLAGFVPDEELGDHYNLCDVFAMPSKGEGFGIVYLEALSCGKPTIGGNQDGAIDALCHGELGVLIDPDDVDALAYTLTQVLQKTYSHPILYQPEVLHQKVIDIYGFSTFKQTLVNLMTSALPGGQP